MNRVGRTLRWGALYLSYTVNRRRIEKALADCGPEKPRTVRIPGPAYRRCAAACLKVAPCPSLPALVQAYEACVAAGVEKGAHIVVFPQYGGMLPLSHLPGFEKLREELHRLPAQERPEAFRLLVESLSGYLLETHLTIFGGLARAYQTTLMGGSLYLVEEGKLLHRSYLFDPRGEVVGHQDKLVPEPWERAFGVEPGEELAAFETIIGKVAVLFEEDLTHFETVRLAGALEAKTILCPGGHFGAPDPGDEAIRYRSLLPVFRAQEAGIYVVRAGLTGELDLPFGGQAGVYAPQLLTPQRDGELAVLPPHEVGAAVGVVNPERLAPPATRPNPQFYRQFLAPLWKPSAPDTTAGGEGENR